MGVLRGTFAHGILYFTTDDCTGQPYLGFSGNLFPYTAVLGRANSFYVESGASTTLRVRSNLMDTGCFVTDATYTVVPATHALDLNDEFVPPFSIVPIR